MPICEITERKRIKYRDSLITAIMIGLLVLTPMFLLGLRSVLTGRFVIPALFYLLFVLCGAFIIVYCAVAEVSLSAEGISQKTLFSRWRFRWQEIENWTMQQYPDFRSDLLIFSGGLPPQRVQVSRAAVNGKQINVLKWWFWEYVGKPLENDEFVRQIREAEIKQAP
ncbi:MAG: hypothetical protein PVG70_16250 [Desulfobacterales bacterium]|jgi:hypothetical protein